jgi:hypothetical protein
MSYRRIFRTILLPLWQPALPKRRVENLRRAYRGEKSLDDIIQDQVIASEMPRILRYFEKMGIAAEITGIMLWICVE